MDQIMYDIRCVIWQENLKQFQQRYAENTIR